MLDVFVQGIIFVNWFCLKKYFFQSYNFDYFSKGFPIYPGSTVTSSLSGDQGGKSGFWLTLTTKDAESKVASYYGSNLTTNGWKAEATSGNGTGTNWAVSKGNLSGYVTVNNSDNLTSILIVLGENTSR